MTDLFEEKLPVHLAMPGGDDEGKDEDDGNTMNPPSNP